MPVIVLLTDFGLSDPYVGQIKGALLTGVPDAVIIDLCHDLRPFDILQAAFFLSASAPHFPDNTLFLSVVDPGVGTTRRMVMLKKNNQLFLAPDNGLLSLIVQQPGPTQAWELPPGAHGPNVSRTFHGRDILAPTAVQLCRGMEPDRLGRVIPGDNLVSLLMIIPILNGENLTAHILHTDRFGNLILNLAADPWLGRVQKSPSPLALTVRGKRFPIALVDSYADIPDQRLGLIPGSQGYLELAVNQDSAATMLECGPGDQIVLNLS